MANTYEQMFSNPVVSQKNYDAIIKRAFRQSKNNITDKKAKIISQYLTNVYYPTENTKQEYRDLNKLVTDWAIKYLENQTGRVIKNFDFSKNTLTEENISINEKYKIIVDEYERFRHQDRIAYETIVKRRQNIKQRLDELNLISKIDDSKIQQLQKDCQLLFDEYDKIVKEFENSDIIKAEGKTFHYLSFKEYPDLEGIINETDTIYQDICILKETNIPNWLSGYLFEASMAIIAGNSINNIIEEDLLKGIKIETAGGGTASRGGLAKHQRGLAFLDTKIKVENQKTKKGKDIKNKYVIKVGDQSAINISETFTPKQAKMDVELDFNFLFNDDKTPMRASLKNWSQLAYNGTHDFGETTIFDALLRTTEDPRSFLEFGLQIGHAANSKNPEYKDYIDLLHTFAQMSLILDVLIGFSQKNQSADMIIINDRKNRCVKVYRVTAILDGIHNVMNKVIEDNKYTSYSSSEIENNIINSGLDWDRALGQQQNYAESLQSALTKAKYTVYDRILLLDKNMKDFTPKKLDK